jgi:PAS domain S-box-containing protein
MKNTGASSRKSFLRQLGLIDQVFGLFEFMPNVSFFVKDRRGRFIALNRKGCQYCGVSCQEEAFGKTDHDFFPKSRADEYRADDLAVMKSGEAIVDRVESAPEYAGSPRLVMTSKIPLRSADGKVIGVAGFSRSVEQIQSTSGTADAFAKVIAHLHDNFADRLSSSELADMAGLSVSHFERRFRRAFNASPRQYLLRVRVEHAASMLLETDKTISQVALACGFYDHAHFSRSFQRIMRQTPSEYRKQ